MKLYRFVKAQQGSFNANFVNQDLKDVARNLSPEDILEMLQSKQQYIPDIIALVYDVNRSNFDLALKKWIKPHIYGAAFGSTVNNLVANLGLSKEDIENEIYKELTSSLLKDIGLHGSRGDQFKWTKSKSTNADLQNSIKMNSLGIKVPFCPFCEQCGQKRALFEVEINAEKSGFESKGNFEKDTGEFRHNFSQSLPPEQYEKLTEVYPAGTRKSNDSFIVSNGSISFRVTLDSTTQGWITSTPPLRNLEISNDKPILHCNFALGDAPRSIGGALWTQGPNKIIRNLNTGLQKALNRLTSEDFKVKSKIQELEKQKENLEKSNLQLPPDKAQELEKLETKFQKRQRDLVTQIVSIDSATSKDEGRTLHETISSSDRESEEELQSLLSEAFEQSDFDLLVSIRTDPLSLKVFSQAVDILRKLARKDPSTLKGQKRLQDSSYANAVKQVAQLESRKTSGFNQPTCLTCRAPMSLATCTFASALRRHTYIAYTHSMRLPSDQRQQEFDANIGVLDEHEKAHLIESEVTPHIHSLLSLVEVSEDDFFSNDETLSFESFNRYLESKLNASQKQSYQGTNITKGESDISEFVANIDQLIAAAIRRDLVEELGRFLLNN